LPLAASLLPVQLQVQLNFKVLLYKFFVMPIAGKNSALLEAIKTFLNVGFYFHAHFW